MASRPETSQTTAAGQWCSCLRRVTVMGDREVPLAPQGQDDTLPVDWLELHGATPVHDRPAAACHDP
jgi:hypothetical protein